MAQYTIEDIEILRQKSGITYEEAVNLLEYHNGSLARALVDLEKNGRIKENKTSANAQKGFKGIFNFLYRLRLTVKKGNVTVLNVSSLFVLLTLITATHICVIGLIVAMVLGYRIGIDRRSDAFAEESFDSIVRNAKTNVQHTVSSISKQFSDKEDAQKETQPDKEPQRPRADSAPSGTTPVNVQFPNEAHVEVRDDGDGYHEADIQ